MPTMEAVVDRGESPQLRIVGAGDGGEAIRAGVEPLLRAGVDGWKTVGIRWHGWLAVPLAAAVFVKVTRVHIFLAPWFFLQLPF